MTGERFASVWDAIEDALMKGENIDRKLPMVRVASARFDRDASRVVVELASGIEVAFPVALVRSRRRFAR